MLFRSSASSYRIGSLRFDGGELRITAEDGRVASLSRGDAALLQALCRRPGEVVGRSTLARLTGSLVDVQQSRSIDVRLSRLRRLLEDLQGVPGGVLETRRGQGYSLIAPVAAIPTSPGE